MKLKAIFSLAVAVFVATSCGSSTQHESPSAKNAVDSIKIEVSTKLGSNHILLSDASEAILRLQNCTDSTLSAESTTELKS